MIINLKKISKKLLLDVYAIVAVESPVDVRNIQLKNTGQRSMLKFASASGVVIAAHLPPGTFTN